MGNFRGSSFFQEQDLVLNHDSATTRQLRDVAPTSRCGFLSHSEQVS